VHNFALHIALRIIMQISFPLPAPLSLSLVVLKEIKSDVDDGR
jgi:hypothetical protein